MVPGQATSDWLQEWPRQIFEENFYGREVLDLQQV